MFHVPGRLKEHRRDSQLLLLLVEEYVSDDAMGVLIQAGDDGVVVGSGEGYCLEGQNQKAGKSLKLEMGLVIDSA